VGLVEDRNARRLEIVVEVRRDGSGAGFSEMHGTGGIPSGRRLRGI
jgi:hypothetical protein